MAREKKYLSDLQLIRERLTSHGLKVTSQRLAIFQCLFMQHDHPSAEIIYQRIKNEHPSISMATVYKTMETLVAAGLVKKVKTDDELLRFDARAEDHSHLYCSNTNQILDYEDAELQNMLERYFEQKKIENFEISNFQLQITGIKLNKNKSIKAKQIK